MTSFFLYRLFIILPLLLPIVLLIFVAIQSFVREIITAFSCIELYLRRGVSQW